MSPSESHLWLHAYPRREVLCACVLLWICACRSGEGGLASASAALAPHREAFARFDRWARQLQASDVALGSRAALAETTFAPLRGQSSVIAARVEARESDEEGISRKQSAFGDERALELPVGCAWPALNPAQVRDAELGLLHVALLSRCGFGRASPERADEPCTVVSRQAPLPGGGQLEVRVAYRDERERDGTAAP